MRTISKSLILIVFTLSIFLCSAQSDCTATEWEKQILLKNPSILLTDRYLANFNFSNILLDDRTCYLGYIGDNYQRLYINFTEIHKETSTEYSVKGNTAVKSNLCDFNGTIIIKRLCELQHYYYGVDDEMKGKIKKQGFTLADILLCENNTQKGSGIFKGILLIKWYVDTNNVLLYDDIANSSDSYCNNQFLGKWTSYRTNVSKKCAWGHYRIPCSGDLDIGAAEFSVNPKYNDWGERWNYCGEKKQFEWDIASETDIETASSEELGDLKSEKSWSNDCNSNYYVGFDVVGAFFRFSTNYAMNTKIKKVNATTFAIYFSFPIIRPIPDDMQDCLNYAENIPIAKIERIDDKLKFTWFGFYDTKKKKRVHTQNPFNTNQESVILQKCDR